MSAGKAVGNLLEELLKKDVGDITEDMISAVLKGAAPKSADKLGKGEYNLVHATTQIENKMQGTANYKFKKAGPTSYVKPAPSSSGKAPKQGDMNLVRQAYQKHFEVDVTEDVYEAFRGTKDGYKAGMKTRLDNTGKHTGEFYTPTGKEDILKEVKGDRSRKASPYQEDIEYVQGGRRNLKGIRKRNKAAAEGSTTNIPVEEQSKLDLGLIDQKDFYRRKEFGSAAHSEALPEFEPEKYKPQTQYKGTNRKTIQKAQSRADEAVDRRNTDKEKKYNKSVEKRNKIAEEYTEKIKVNDKVFGGVFEETKDGETFYRASELGGKKYRTKEGAKAALQKRQKANVKKYGEAYYDERIERSRAEKAN